MSSLKYRRVLLKISGEALAGDATRGLDFDVIGQVCDVVARCNREGVQVGIVVGGGNFWRGLKDGKGMRERTRADHMGMLATSINCLALADMLELGELSGSCHREIGEYIVSRKEGAPDLVVLIGRESRHIAEAIREKGGRQQIRHFMENDNFYVLIKNPFFCQNIPVRIFRNLPLLPYKIQSCQNTEHGKFYLNF